jgi:hypothetical protein
LYQEKSGNPVLKQKNEIFCIFFKRKSNLFGFCFEIPGKNELTEELAFSISSGKPDHATSVREKTGGKAQVCS